MNGVALAVAVLLLVQGGASFLDERIGAHDKKAPPGMAELTIGQLMQLTALPRTRIDEARCTGFVLSGRYKGPASAARKAELKAAMTAAIANDSRLGDIPARHFVTMMIGAASEDPPQPSQCAGFVAMTEAEAPLAIAPLLKTDLVDPVLASCAARYAVAAETADAASRDNLAKEAERARVAALKGKSGTDLARAEAALEEAILAERSGEASSDERGVMGLVMCQPLLTEDAK